MDSIDIEKIANEWWIQRRQLVIAAGLFVGALVLLSFGAYRFWLVSSELQISIEQQEKELRSIEQRATVLNTITPEDKAGYLLVERALPRFKEPLQVMRTLEAISQDTQVSLGEYDLNPGIVSTESAVQAGSSRNRSKAAQSDTLRIEIEMSGTFQQLTTAIQNVEESMPIMEITDLRIAPARRNTENLATVQYTATIQLESYYSDVSSAKAATGAQQISPGQRRAKEKLEAMQYWLESRGSAQQDAGGDGNSDIFQLSE